MRGREAWVAGCLAAIAGCSSAVPTGSDGGTGCDIANGSYAAGDANPTESCQVCNPSLSADAWTSQPDLTDCRASGAGTYCELGKCVNSCAIGGLVILAGTVNPDDACQVCTPSVTLDTWSQSPSCPDGGSPDAGFPDGGPDAGADAGPDAGEEDGGPPSCIIGGAIYLDGQAVGPCRVCETDAGSTASQPLADGTLCDGGAAGGNVCVSGACTPGCWIAQALVAPHSFQGDDQALWQDSCCNPGLNAADWTPGYAALPALAPLGVSALAAAAVTGTRMQILAGDSSGSVKLYTQLSDGGFGSQTVVTSGAAVSAVAAIDVTGDGLVDVLYETGTSPTLVAQTAGHSFGAAKTWPAIPDGGGLWAESSDAGPQVLSFDFDYSSAKFSSFPSYLQPQYDVSGVLQDSCQVTGEQCVPTQLAFGSFRNAGGIEFVMTCMEPDLGPSDSDSETFYGAFTPGQCNGQPGWQMDQFVHDIPSIGAVVGPIVTAGDLNGDGLSEVVGGGNIGIEIQMNWGPASGTFFSTLSLPLEPKADIAVLQIANLRADAGGNVLALDVGNSELEVYYPPPPYDAGVKLTAKYPVTTGSTGMVTGDFDGDGRPDVAVSSASGLQVFHRQCP